MAAEPSIRTRCPACGAKYAVPAATVGHRARCIRCKGVFRVTDHSHGSSVAGDRLVSRAADNSSSTLNPKRHGSSTALNPGRHEGPGKEPHTLQRPPTDEDILRWLNEGNDEDAPAARPRIIGGGPPAKKPVPSDPTARQSASSGSPGSRATKPDAESPADPLSFRKTPPARQAS